MSFAFPFANFFQPGVFWPALADIRPMQILAVLALLATLGRRASYNRMDAVAHPAAKWLLLFLFVQVISVYRSGLAAVASEFMDWLPYALFVLLSLRIITDGATLRSYVWGMMCGSAWIILWGIYAVHAGLMGENGNRAGAYGMYENHNDYSFIIVQALPFFFIFWRNETSRLRRWFLMIATVASIIGIFLSLSRGGMIALVIEIVLIVWLTMGRRARLVLLPLVIAAGAAAISYQYIARAANQGNDYTAEDAETSRYELWRAGENMLKAHPFLGVGSRTFGEHSTEYEEISHDNLGKNAHNTFIEVAATSGLLGFGCFLLMIRGAIRETRKPRPGEDLVWESRICTATLIALATMCFRAMFDAKPWDWSFYVLATIAAACGGMWKSRQMARAAAADAQGVEGGEAAESDRLPA